MVLMVLDVWWFLMVHIVPVVQMILDGRRFSMVQMVLDGLDGSDRSYG